jgi:spermidine/putrescine transport system permease protein
MRDGRTLVWQIGAGAILFYMVSPIFLLVLFAFSSKSIISFPIEGLTLSWFYKLFGNPVFWISLKNSLIVTAITGFVSTIVGTMAASALIHLPPRTVGMVTAALALPVMLPPLVLAVALSNYYGGLGVPFGLPTVIIGHLVFTQPFVILIVHARLAGFDYRIVNSARDLGASPLKAFFTITLPVIRPTILGAALVAMALSLDDFILTFFTIGGGSTLPIYMWGLMRKGVNPQINVASLVLITMTIGISLLALRATKYRG